MKFLITLFVVLYLYTVAYGIFLTEVIRIPAPILFGLPIIIVFKQPGTKFIYTVQLSLFIVAMFFYDVVGLSEYKVFISNVINVSVCAFYFNYFVGSNRKRFNLSIYVFFALLLLSALVMVLNPFYFTAINNLRSALMGEPVLQSPSGIAAYQFNFGYQLAALTPFLLVSTFVFDKPFYLKMLALMACLLFIYLGMQRSVFVGFTIAVLLFLWMHYGYKAVFIIAIAALAAIILYTYLLKDNFDSYNNIITKNEHNAKEYDRSTLSAENLRIYAAYPYGLIFYGMNWSDVIYRNQVFSSGITSHNAYLMFVTYLGPFLGLGLLFSIYYKIGKIITRALYYAKEKENAMMICLGCAFIAVSINSLSHNSWLLSANGPTFFLYFAILQLHFIIKNEKDKNNPSDRLSE